MRIAAIFSRERVLGGVIVLAATQFGASLAGLLREYALNRMFQDHLEIVDAYIAAFRPSDLLFQTCVVSALGTVLVPVLAKYRAEGNGRELEKVLGGTVGMAAVIFGCVALVMAAVFPWLLPLFHIQFTGETLALYVQFGRLALLSNFLFVFGNAYGQYLITVERYWVYGLTPILYSLGTVFGTIVLTPSFGPFGPMYGTVLGALVYVLLRMWGVHRSGCRITFSFWHPDLPGMGRLMLPRILALGAFQLQLLYLDGFASGLPSGSVTVNAAARNFQSVLVGVVGIAVAQAVYSRMSQAAAKRQMPVFRRYLRSGLLLSIVLTVPGAIALVLLSPIAAAMVHLQKLLPVFTISLLIYAVSIPFESVSHIQYRAFYAMKETILPALMGVVGGVAAIAVGWLFLEQYGVYSLAAGYTVGEIVQALGLGILLPIKQRRFVMMGDTEEPPHPEAAVEAQ